MSHEAESLRARVRTPRAAALAGVLFALLLMGSQILIWLSIPANPWAPAMEAFRSSKALAVALNLVPFAGIAFLWFIAVVRDHIGEFEDRFFATVFLGSGLLYLAMLFVGAALAGALIGLLTQLTDSATTSAAYLLGRGEIYRITTTYGTRMAGVFMISSSTIFVRTGVVPRWVAVTGYVLAVTLLLSIGSIKWVGLTFPLWVLLISICILVQKDWGRRGLQTRAAQAAAADK
jgi:hypothetical protein